jgi:DUF971 family protein
MCRLPLPVAAATSGRESPSAEVQGHAPEQKILVAGKREVGIAEIEPVGNYAVQITWGDGTSQLSTFEQLSELAAGVRAEERRRGGRAGVVKEEEEASKAARV